MKKALLFISILAGTISSVSAQCTITPGCSVGTSGYCTTPAQNTNLPNATEGSPYSTTIQMSLGNSYGGVATIYSATVVAVTGLPTGVTYAINPTGGVVPANSNACALISGTPNAGTAGTYTVTAILTASTNLGGIPVTATWSLTVDPAMTTGIATISQSPSTIVMAPNPVSAELNLYADFHFNKVQVMDALGNIVMTQEVNGANQLNMDLRHLHTGVYFVQIHDGSRILTRRFIKD